MSMIDRKPIFDAIRKLRNNQKFTIWEVKAIDDAIDQAEGVIVVRAQKDKGRQINAAGEKLIQLFEGCELEAYLDVAGIPTIGWGHTGPEVHLGQVITQEEADRLFDEDTDRFEAAVDRLTDGKATDNQFAAMVALCYNIGIGTEDQRFPGGFTRSSVLRHHKAGDFEQAADAFSLWNKATVEGKLVVVKGLTRRRAAEAELYRKA